MDRSLLISAVIGSAALAVVATAAAAGNPAANTSGFAEIVAVKEVKQKTAAPKEVCEQVQVKKQAPVKDENRLAGTVLGGVAGGLLGNQVGGGTGKTVATVAGAAAGAYAGNQVQKGMQEKDVVTTTETRCKTVEDSSEKVVGYDVTYRLDGKQSTVRMSYDPRKQIPLRDGQPALASSPAPGK
jgi:uncharacterized protein YcfJ